MNRRIRLGPSLLPSVVSGDFPPIFFLGGTVLLLFAPYFLRPGWFIWPRSGLGSDAIHMYWVEHLLLARGAASGYLPLWDDLIVTGRPISGGLSAMGVYPFTFLYPMFSPAFAFTLVNALHVFLAGVFGYFLIRALFRATRVAATIGAFTFMLAPQLIAHLAGGHLANVRGMTWMPAVLLGACVSVQSRRLQPAALGGAALGLQVMTHPQMPIGTFYLLVGMLGWWCWRTLTRAGWRSSEFSDAVKRSITVGVFIGGVAALVSAAWWMPIAEVFPWTARIEFGVHDLFWYQLPPFMLLSLLAPTEFQFPEWTIYVGTVPLFLALIALTGERRRDAAFLWVAAGLALVISLGDATPVYTLARWVVPGLGYYRTRTRVWAFGGFLVALLAAMGVDALRSRKTQGWVNRHWRWLNLGSTAYLLGGAVAVLGLGMLKRRMPIEVLRAVGAGALSLIGFWLWRRRPSARPVYRVALVVALFLDLFPLATEFMMGVDPKQGFLKPDAVIEFLASQPGDYRVYSAHHNLSYPLSAEFGIESIDGFENLQLAHVAEIVKVASGCRLNGYTGGVPPCVAVEIDSQAYRTAKPEPDLLGLLNVRYVIADFPLDVPDLESVFVDGQITVYENRRFLPRAFLVDRVEALLAGTDTFEQLLAVDVAHSALVEHGTLPMLLPDGPVESEVAIVSRRPGRMVLAVRSDREALLIYSEAWAPGWQAAVDGDPAQALRVDGALLGVIVPAGASRVAFDYYPLGWRIGCPISLVTIMALAAWVGLSLVRQRRQHEEARYSETA